MCKKCWSDIQATARPVLAHLLGQMVKVREKWREREREREQKKRRKQKEEEGKEVTDQTTCIRIHTQLAVTNSLDWSV